jgi:PKD repeat protein
VASFTTLCDNNGSCSFDASGSTGSGLTYSWTFGDGQSGTGVRTSHSYDSDGSYMVTLTVTDSSGRTSTVQHTATVAGS